jgi:hypothetical protein
MLLRLQRRLKAGFWRIRTIHRGCDVNTNSAADDRRKQARDTPDRRDDKTRSPGSWTEAERERRTAAIREELHDSRAKTIHGRRTGT